ncbi:hypothetical protein OCU04_004137 [Sclerotinia nivalis]|uniref:Uncharacterized protein n=1 Tax=Sclerotinia nivalis TaxID=352851 RepID=A0A9X0APU6_9HELO|nr:hypothetical protein OCU04_004137 [Sclerotinia nivalis]
MLTVRSDLLAARGRDRDRARGLESRCDTPRLGQHKQDASHSYWIPQLDYINFNFFQICNNFPTSKFPCGCDSEYNDKAASVAYLNNDVIQVFEENPSGEEFVAKLHRQSEMEVIKNIPSLSTKSIRH